MTVSCKQAILFTFAVSSIFAMNQKHCHVCGTLLTERLLEGEGIVPWCPACQDYRFPIYNTAVSMIVVNEHNSNVLLIRQYGRPSFILVAGYVNRGEALEDAVRREVKEETGITVSRVRFNRSRFFEPSNTLMCNFTAHVCDAERLTLNEEVDDCHWFTPEEARQHIRPGSLAQWFFNEWLAEEDKTTDAK